MSKSWKKNESTYETDKYVEKYLFVDGNVFKTIWEDNVFVGPEVFNRAAVQMIRNNQYNKTSWIMDNDDPQYVMKRYSVNTQKLKV